MRNSCHAHLLLPLGLVACGSYTDSCFVAGTLVDTDTGSRPIEMLRIGDIVWSFSLERKVRVARRVAAVLASEARETRRIEVGGRVIAGVTPSHPFYDVGRGTYREVRDLKLGDLLALGGDGIVPRAIERIVATELSEQSVPVFNLTVDGPESNYFAAGILVHNKSLPPPPSCHFGGVQIAEHDDGPDASLLDRFDGSAVSSTGDFDVAWSSDPGSPTIQIRQQIGSQWDRQNAVVTRVTATLYRIRLERPDPGAYEVAAYGTLRPNDAGDFCRAEATHRFSILTATEPDASTDVGSDASAVDVEGDRSD